MERNVATPRSFRVFVSSTFDDLVAERDTLQRGIRTEHGVEPGAFQRLRQLCEARGAGFQPIDLRWGVSPGPQAHAMKLGFEKYFLWKMRHGYVQLP